MGGEDWRGLCDWLREVVLAKGRIDPADMDILQLRDDPAEVAEVIGPAPSGR